MEDVPAPRPRSQMDGPPHMAPAAAALSSEGGDEDVWGAVSGYARLLRERDELLCMLVEERTAVEEAQEEAARAVEEEHDKCEVALAALLLELASAEASRAEAKSRCTALEAACFNLKQQANQAALHAVGPAHAVLEGHLAETQAQLDDALSTLSAQRSENEGLTGRLARELARAGGERSSSEAAALAEVASLRERLEEAASRVSSLQEEALDAADQLRDKTSRLEEALAHLEASQVALYDAQEAADTVRRGAGEAAERAAQEHGAEVATLKAHVATLECRAQALQSEVVEAQARAAELRAAASAGGHDAASAVASLHEAVKAVTHRLDAAHADALAAHARAAVLEVDLSVSKAAQAEAASRIADLEAALLAADVAAPSPQRVQEGGFEKMVGFVTEVDENDSLSFPSASAFLTHLRGLGCSRAQLVFGIDLTKSNLWSGKGTFGGRPLHDVSNPSVQNPYQRVMCVFARVLRDFDDDGLIPLYGFGCSRTTDRYVQAFREDGAPCSGLDDVLATYARVIPTVPLAGPTSFAPLIKKALDTIKKDRCFTVLVIIADGQVTAVKETEAAIVEASRHPLAIVCIGVGDGPWQEMHRFDTGLPTRKVDNFQFVELQDIEKKAKESGRKFDDFFALSALAELPTAYKAMKKARIL